MSDIGQGTTDYTVKSIMDRLFSTYLTPPDAQFAQAQLGAAMTDIQESVVIGQFFIPEDEELMRAGAVIEVGQELMQVLSYDRFELTTQVQRGLYGTPITAHPIPNVVKLNPPFTRSGMFEAVADNIILLYPKLYTSEAVLLSPATNKVYSLGDPLAVEVLSAQPGDFTSDIDIHGEIVDFHPMTGGRSFISNIGGGTIWLRYRRRMGRALNEADLLHNLGVDSRWVNIIMAGAAADLLAGRDIPAARTEWIESVLEAESIQVGTRMSLAGGLRQYRNILLQEAMKEMKAEYRPKINMRQAMNQVV